MAVLKEFRAVKPDELEELVGMHVVSISSTTGMDFLSFGRKVLKVDAVDTWAVITFVNGDRIMFQDAVVGFWKGNG